MDIYTLNRAKTIQEEARGSMEICNSDYLDTIEIEWEE